MEGAHGELGSRLADRLGGDDAHRHADLDDLAGGEVASVAQGADAARGGAGQNRADADVIDAGGIHVGGLVFGDLFVRGHDDAAAERIADVEDADPADDAIAQGLDDFAGLDDRPDLDAFRGAAVVFRDDDILGHVHEATGEVTGVGGLERGIREALAGAVGGDEVLQHRETFTEVVGDRVLDDLAGRTSHQAAHAGELTKLLLRTAGAGVGHDVDRVEVPGLVLALHALEHGVGHVLGGVGPDGDDLVVALAVGDGAVEVLLFHGQHVLVALGDDLVLDVGDHQVGDADRDAGLGGVEEAEILHRVEGVHRLLETVAEVDVLDELLEAALLEQAVDERDALEVIGQDHPADRGVDHPVLDVLNFAADDILIVVHGGEVDQLAGVLEADGSEGFDFARGQGEENVLEARERAAGALRVLLLLGEVVAAEDDVLARHRDGLAVRGREDVVRREHQNQGFDLGLRSERDVDRHLVAVEVGVEGRADERMDLDGLALDQDRLEGLDAEAMQGGSAVQENRMLGDDLIEVIPHFRMLLFDLFLRGLDRADLALALELGVHERLEEFEGHLLRQTALVQLQFGTDHDDRTAGVVDALAEQVLTEPALLALEGVGERLERTVVGAPKHAATAAVVE